MTPSKSTDEFIFSLSCSLLLPRALCPCRECGSAILCIIRQGSGREGKIGRRKTSRYRDWAVNGTCEDRYCISDVSSYEIISFQLGSSQSLIQRQFLLQDS